MEHLKVSAQSGLLARAGEGANFSLWHDAESQDGVRVMRQSVVVRPRDVYLMLKTRQHHRTTRDYHTMHEHASPPRLGAPHGMPLVLLLCSTATEFEDAHWQTFAHKVEVDVGAAGCRPRRCGRRSEGAT